LTTPLSDDADIFDSFGIDGDDAFEFIERFVSKFKIDATNYRWYYLRIGAQSVAVLVGGRAPSYPEGQSVGGPLP
jgi:hypothetical protein